MRERAVAERWTVQSARQRKVSGTDVWEIVMLRADGKPHAHIVPTAALDWRAAEYGIDPDDTDTLLEAVLHEPFMEQAEDEDGQQPKWADGSVDLLGAENTTVAREAHLARAKACRVRIDVKGVTALAPVRDGHRPDRARIREMQEAVDTTRWVKRYGNLPAKPLDPKEARRA